jgi:cell filamentation protein
MKKSGRYNTSGMIEDQYEDGSKGQVLRNKQGIKSLKEIEHLETIKLLQVTDTLVDSYSHDHRFTADDICHMHKLWLGSVYEWAGHYRRVMISKTGFPFANPEFIPRLMEEFEKNILHKYTPCVYKARNQVIEALATVHVEFLLIHPFREGNGRLARLISTLMALQAGLPLLDFTDIDGEKKDEYFAAVRAGINRDYKPMGKVFSEVISLSEKVSGKG